MRHVVSRGHEHESRRSSSRGDHVRDDMRMLSPYSAAGAYVGGAYGQPPSYGGSSGGDDMYYDGESPYLYEYDQQGGDPNQPQSHQKS